MNKKIEQLEELAQSVSLSENERARVSSELETYMEDTPVRSRALKRQTKHRQIAMPLSFIKLHPMPIAVLLIAALLGGGTSVAAASSLPGDTLYSVKTEINEPIRGMFKFSDENKAEWQEKLAERRNGEMSDLKAKGELSPERLRKAKHHFNKHTERLGNLVTKLEEVGEAEVAAEIQVHMSAMQATHDEIKAQLDTLPEDLTREETKEAHDEIRAQYNNEIETQKEELKAVMDELKESGVLPEPPEKPTKEFMGQMIDREDVPDKLKQRIRLMHQNMENSN